MTEPAATPTREALATQLDHHLQTWGDLRMLSLDEGKQIIAALRALPPAPAVGTWQPIETAPSAERVLVLFPDCPYPLMAVRHGRDWTTVRRQSWAAPTHWQPLPPPPAGAAEEA